MMFSNIKLSFFGAFFVVAQLSVGNAYSCSKSWQELHFADGSVGCTIDFKFFTIKRPSAPDGLSDLIEGWQSFSVAITKNLKKCPITRTDWSWGNIQKPTASIALKNCEHYVIDVALKKGIDPRLCDCEVVFDASPNLPNVPLAKSEFEIKTRAWAAATQNNANFKSQYTQDELIANSKFFSEYTGESSVQALRENLSSEKINSNPANNIVISDKKNELKPYVNSEKLSNSAPSKTSEQSGLSILNRQTTKSVKALVIGNSSYSVSALVNPANDAKAVANRLTDFGFKVDLVIDGNRKALINALTKFQSDSAKYEVNILFYAGHGIQLNGINYIIPVDMSLAPNGSNVEFDAIPVNSIIEKYLQANTKLVFLDACRDNPLSRSLQVASRSSGGGSRGLAAMEVSGGTLISYSTKDGSVALDGDGKNSPYTEAMLVHINEPIDISLLLRKVRKTVMAKTNGKQVPWDYGSLMSDELVLSNKQ